MRSNARLDRRFLLAACVGLSTFALGACGDDPFEVRWVSDIDTVTLYSLARPEIGLASAFDFANLRLQVVENIGATGSWDMAVDDDGNQAVFVPPGALGIPSRAGIVPISGVSFNDVTEAPADTALYIRDTPVPVEVGRTYALRTRELRGFFSQLCVYYAKIQPIAVDLETGTVAFFYEASPACNDRNLVPNETN